MTLPFPAMANLQQRPERATAGPNRDSDSRLRRGFSLVEALVAITIMAMASAVVLLGIETSVQNADFNVDSMIAEGMAQQLIDEVLGTRYTGAATDPYQYPLVASSWELAGKGRERFDDTDDFNGFVANGAEDIWGQPLGTDDGQGGLRHESLRVRSGLFADWRQKVAVYYVDSNDPSVKLSGNKTSNYRAVEVTISRKGADGVDRTLASLRRVYAYVPAPESTW